MHDLPNAIINILMNFAPLFSRPVFHNVCLLFKAHILSKGRRTITDMLRQLGLHHERKFSKFHRVFYGAKWSGLQASQILFKLLYKLTSSNEEMLIAIDSTIERRRGPKIKGLGSMRDPIASTKSNKVLTIGLSWLVTAVIIRLPWSSKNWALPFLTILMPPKKPLKSSTNENKDFHKHKTMTHWTCQIAKNLRRWTGKSQKITLVADSAFACFYIANTCIDLFIGLISRLRKDARLYEFPSIPTKKTKGRPRILGQRGREKIRMRAILSRFFRRFQIASPSITFTFRCGRGGDLKDAKKLDKSALHLYFFSASETHSELLTPINCFFSSPGKICC